MSLEPCHFCETCLTTAELADGTPVCWRPCYAAILKVQGGREPFGAIMLSIDEAAAPGALLMRLKDSRFDVEGAAARIDTWVHRWRGRALNAPPAAPALGSGQ